MFYSSAVRKTFVCLYILCITCLKTVAADSLTVVKKTGRTLYGQASFYADKFSGKKTASGEVFNHNKYTAACNALPLGTWIQVTNLRNGKIAVVKTNDRLHPKTKRLIDLTSAAAKKLGFIKAGLTRVKVVVLDQSLYKKLH